MHKTHSLVLACLCCYLSVQAQSPRLTNEFTLNEAIEYALEHNYAVLNQGLAVKASALKEKSPFTFGGTEFYWQRGNINSVGVMDNAWQITQDFGSPLAQLSGWKLRGRTTDIQRAAHALTKQQLTWQVKLAYYKWIWLEGKRKIFEELLNLDLDYLKLENKRYARGEINDVEKAIATTDAASIQMKLQENLIELGEAEIELQQLLGFAQPVRPTATEPKKILLDAAMVDLQSVVKHHPEVNLAKVAQDYAIQNFKTTRAELLPSVYLGYFGLEIDRESGAQGWYAGVTIPLYFFHQKAEIQGAKLESEISSNELEFTKIRIATQSAKLIKAFDRASIRLQFYELQALPQSDLIVQNSFRLLEEKEIDYIEYLNSMSRALAIKLEYQDVLYDYNTAIINLEFLMSE